MAAENAALNGLAERARVVVADVFDAPARRAAGLADEAADLVVTNPPFFEPGDGARLAATPARARAHVFAGERARSPLIGLDPRLPRAAGAGRTVCA